jgi:hypothetical protein
MRRHQRIEQKIRLRVWIVFGLGGLDGDLFHKRELPAQRLGRIIKAPRARCRILAAAPSKCYEFDIFAWPRQFIRVS